MPTFSLPALVRALLVWLAIILAESVQGAARRFLLDPDVEFAIRQLSVGVGVVVIFAITWACFRWMRIRSDAGALAVGVLWAILTLAFELGLGSALGADRARLLADYDLAHGGLMPLGLLAMALTPWIVRRLKYRRPDDLDQGAGRP